MAGELDSIQRHGSIRAGKREDEGERRKERMEKERGKRRGPGLQQRMGEDPAVPLPTLRRRVPIQGHGAVAGRPRRQLLHVPLGTFSGSGRQREHLDSANSTCSSGRICSYATSRFAEVCMVYGEGLHKGEAGNAVLLCTCVQNAVQLFCLRPSSSMKELGSMMVSLLQQSQIDITITCWLPFVYMLNFGYQTFCMLCMRVSRMETQATINDFSG